MTGNRPTMARPSRIDAAFAVVAVFIVAMATGGRVSAGECGRLCDLRWMANASVADVKAELDARPEAIGQRQKDFTPLHAAAMTNPDPGVAALLLAQGAGIGERTSTGATPLHLAAGGIGMGQMLAISTMYRVYLIKHGSTRALARVHEIRSRYNLSGNDLNVVRFLVDKGANIAAVDGFGQTPLHYAAAVAKRWEVVEYFLKRGAKANAISKRGHNPLHFAASGKSHPKIVQLLLDYGADATLKSSAEYGMPIHAAAMSWNTSALKLLIGKGVDINVRNENGVTPLHLAAINAVPELARTLIGHGANLESKDRWGKTPLHYAVRKTSNPAVALLLIESGASIDATDNDGKTTLDHFILTKQNKRAQDFYFYREGIYRNTLEKIENILKR